MTIGRVSTWRSLWLAGALAWLGIASATAQSGIGFVQVNAATPQSPQAVVAATYTSAQTAGNFNVVAVGWNDTVAQVVSVTDSAGNTYVRAIGPTTRAGLGSQSIYYAASIAPAAAGANTVTVTFTVPAVYVDLRIAEYRGIDNNNPVDVAIGAGGSGATTNSGLATTNNPNDLLVGASLIAQTTVAAGTGYTSRIITVPDNDILEDRLVTAVGSYNATARVTGGTWVMHMVAFRAAGGLPDAQAPTAPGALTATPVSATTVSLSWTASSDNVGVTGYRIERCLGATCTTFAQIGATTSTTYSDTTAAAGNTYNYRVRANDAAGNMSGYSNVVSATSAADTQAPSAPSNLAASVVSSTRINLAWTASTDNIGVTGYRIERCVGAGCTTFAQIGTSTSAAYSDLTATAGTAYNYRVRANDAAGNLSIFSNVVSATAASDTQAPTAPANLIATVQSNTQINLTWTASTDNIGVTGYRIERCSGAGCSSFAQIGATATATTFADAGLTAGTAYSYRVLATDAAINLSAYSNVVSATTTAPDTQAPTAPANLTATAPSNSQINLAWTASTDNIGVTGYRIERCSGTGCSGFAQIGTTTTATTFGDTGLTAGTTYSYRVLAIDAAINLSAYSDVASATTTAPDTQAPTAPANLTATAQSNSQINLTWTASSDNVAVTSYLIERCQGAGCTTFTQVGAATSTTFNNTGLAGSTSYSYRVRATDAASNLGDFSPVASATTNATPAIAFVQVNAAVPQTAQTTVTIPFTLAQSSGNLNVVVVGWNSATGQVASVTDTRGNPYTRAVGPTAAGFGTQSIYYSPSIQPAAANANSVIVTFAAAVPYADIRIAEYSGIVGTDPVDVVAAATGSGTSSATGTVTTANPTDLIVGANLVTSYTSAPGASFTSRVITAPDGDILEDRIVAAVGTYNASASILSGDWIMQMVAFKAGSAGPDTQAPTAPSNVVAGAASTQINLSWTAAADNVGVTGYRIERCSGVGCSTFTEIAAPAGTATTFTDTGLTASTTYGYRVRATDAAGNLGGYSNVAAATTQTPDVEPPTAPGTLVAAAISGTQINVSWGAATDNVGVAGYRLERCQGVGCTNFTKLGTTITGTSFSDTSLGVSTTYNYIVRAQDAEGNLGPYSNVAGATTLSTNPNLVAAYAFNEGGGTAVADASGQGNNGSLANATWTNNGKFGKALSFNGTNALVTVPDAPILRLTTAMTLEAWVNPSVPNFGWRDVVYKGNDNYYLEGATPSGVPAIGVTIGATATEAFAASQLPANTWTFLAASYDGTTLRFYVNGTQVASQARTGSILTSSNPLQIGGDSLWGQFFQGLIDEVRVYNVALTPGQIQADMVTAIGGSSPAASLSTNNLGFGSVAVGASSTVPVTLTNGGNLTLTVTGVAISGPQASDFSQTNNCITSLAPAASCTINVRFAPSNGGVRNASLSIADNAPGNPHLVALTGTGTGFTVTPQTSVLTPIKAQQFTVSGAGASPVVWSVDGVPGGTGASGTVTATGLYTPPAARGAHTVTVATTDGTKSATAAIFVTNHAGVFTHHNDNQRTGQNLAETVLTPLNVNAAAFGKLASYTIDGIAHAAPLYAANVNIPGLGLRNVVYVATEHDSVYAFDADATGGSPLWKVSFINPAAGITTVPNGDVGECCDITPEIGITGTPVIDPATGTLYVVVKTKESGAYFQRLHALDIATGAEKLGGPILIQASVPGSGSGSSNGTVAFNQLRENQRTALLLHNGTVYFGFGSHGDNQPYHGWLLGYNATSLQRVLAFNTTPNGEGGGIWQSGGGLAIDAAGNFYFATGDGTYSINTGGIDYGNTFMKFNPVSGVLDYFTPHNQAFLDANNLDLDAGGMVLLPDQSGAHPRMLISAGKNGSIHLVDRDNMGGYHPADLNVQTLDNIFPFGQPLPGNYSSPVYFNGAVYFGPVADVVQMFKLTSGLLSVSPTSTTPQSFAYPGGALAISANGTADGILWAIRKDGANPGTLHAYDASNIATEFYNSDQAGTRDKLDAAAKFSVPLVVNGKVFVATEGRFVVFGLIP
jgi:fibronectin type 3 domain-containing protein